MDDVLQAVKVEECSPRSIAELEALFVNGGITQDNASNFVELFLEVVEALNDNEWQLALLFSCLATNLHKCRVALSCGDCLGLVMVLSSTATSDSKLLLPAALDLCSALYAVSLGVAAQAAANDDPEVESLLSELDTLRGYFISAAAVEQQKQHSQGTATKFLMHAVNALRDIVLASLPQEPVEVQRGGTGKDSRSLVNAWTQPKGQPQIMTLEVSEGFTAEWLEDGWTSSIRGIADVFSDANAPIGAVIVSIQAVETLFRHRPASWNTILPLVCEAVRTRGTSGGSLHNVSAVGTLRRFLGLVIATPAASTFHGAAAAALEGIGSNASAPSYHLAGYSDWNADDDEEDDGQILPPDVCACLVQPATGSLDLGMSAAAGAGDEDLIETSVGPMTFDDMLDMVLTSMLAIPAHSDTIENLHLNGLRQMQLDAAYDAQRQEIEKKRENERRGIAGVPPGMLYDYVSGAASLQQPRELITNDSRRGQLMRAGYESMVKEYASLSEEPEARLRQAHALVSRTLCQLPNTVVDIASDELCEMVDSDFLAAPHNRHTTTHSGFELAMQTLFMRYSQLAPTGAAYSLDLLGGGDQRLEYEAPLTSEIDPKNPLEWMDGNKNKRQRDDDPETIWEFRKDRNAQITEYSALACRLMATILSFNPSMTNAEQGQRRTAFRKLVLEAPAITPPMWRFLRQQLCLSEAADDTQRKQRIFLGFLVVTDVLTKRKVYHLEALTMLLALSIDKRPGLPRQIANKQVVALMSKSQLPKTSEESVVDFALKQLAEIPNLQILKSEQQANADDDERHRKLFTLAVDRSINLFLSICTIPAHVGLLGELLTAYTQCNPVLRDLIVESTRLRDVIVEMTRNDLTRGANLVMGTLVPKLQRYPPGSERLVQRILLLVFQEVRTCAADPEQNIAKPHLQAHINGMRAVCRELFEQSAIRLGEANQLTRVIKDVRFMTPVLSCVSTSDIRQQMIPAVLQLTANREAHDDVCAALRQITSSVSLPLDEKEVGMTAPTLLLHLHSASQQGIEGVGDKNFAACIQETLKLVPRAAEILTVLTQLSSAKPVPSLLMMTVLAACKENAMDANFLRSVTNNVVRKLTEGKVWDADRKLWRGVVIFMAEFWPMTKEVLFSLPDSVFKQAARENRVLLERVRELPPEEFNRVSHIVQGL